MGLSPLQDRLSSFVEKSVQHGEGLVQVAQRSADLRLIRPPKLQRLDFNPDLFAYTLEQGLSFEDI
ncbi:MAG: hypothetical protein OXU45_04100 [Candidatus Melainabacteria bacterium]|nr:hypothetical protein [Candidatus Melainabacteria bacterium]